MFFKISVGFVLSNCLNAKKYIWNEKYTIQHRFVRSQTSKSIQYNIYDTKSCEFPINYTKKNLIKITPQSFYALLCIFFFFLFEKRKLKR